MQYPLEESIGLPELLVGRVKEFAEFDQWIDNIPRKLSKSRVILARRKSGKTAFVQRIFNQLWSQNGQVIPFYFLIEEYPIWYSDFAIRYFCTFASQFISFRERDAKLVRNRLSLEEILAYGQSHQLEAMAKDAKFLLENQSNQHYALMWETASSAPHRYASLYDIRFLVIIDELQYIEQFIYVDRNFGGKPMEAMAGGYHSLSESKVAPMLVTGSYIGILLKIMHKYLEAGRLDIVRFEPYLTLGEGLLAVYKYAMLYRVPITHQTALQINKLCLSDPFFISRVILSRQTDKDLTSTEGVIKVVNYEITNRESMMSGTWSEYLRMTFERVNGIHTKHLMLFLNKHSDRYWTPRELKKELKLELSEEEIYRRLELLVESDVIDRGTSDIQFCGLRDGTLNLIIRHRFEEEIAGFAPDLIHEFQEQSDLSHIDKKELLGRISYMEGMMAEHMLAIEFRTKKRFRLSDYFTNVTDDRLLNVIEVMERVPYQRPDGKSEEIDPSANSGQAIMAKTDDGTSLMVEVRNRQAATGLQSVQDLRDNAESYAKQHGVTVLPAFVSLAGFTQEAKSFCEANGIAVAEQIAYDFLKKRRRKAVKK